MVLRIRFGWAAWILLAAIAGVVVYYILNKEKLLKYVVPEITKITLIEADIHSDTAFIRIHAIAQNNAPYHISVDSIICDLSLGGTKLLSEKEHVGLSQEPKKADTVLFTVKIPISRTQNKINSLQDQDSTGLSLHVTIVYSSRKIEFTRNKTIEVPVPPRLRIVKTEQRYAKPFKKELRADLYLEVLNEGKNLDLEIHDLGYRIRIGNDLTTRGKYGKSIYIRPHSGEVLVFPLHFRMQHPASTILKVWTDNDRVPYHLRLDARISAGKMKRIPVIIRGSGTLEMRKEEQHKKERKHKKNSRSGG